MAKPVSSFINNVTKILVENGLSKEAVFFHMIPSIIGSEILERESHVFSMPVYFFKLLPSDSQVRCSYAFLFFVL